MNLIGNCGLAPMAGYTDSGFRRICRSFGATFTVTEMVSAKAIRYGDKKSAQLMQFTAEERPIGIQLFGADPDDLAFAAAFAEKNYHPDFIDINMGCPAPKITGGGAGSRLMDNSELAASLVSATVSAVSIPVTVKMRAGYHTLTAPELAPKLEEAGAAALFVHARTRDQMYHPPISPEVIRLVKEHVSIPVFGNGDIQSRDDIRSMMSETGCDGVLIGRGALGNPFLFSNDHPQPPSLEERCWVILKQAELSVEEKGPYIGIREMRKHVAWYTAGYPYSARLRAAVNEMTELDQLEELLTKIWA